MTLQAGHDGDWSGRLAIGAAAMACAVAVSSTPTQAASHVFYVDSSAPTGGNGLSWQSAFRDIHDAIRAPTSGDVNIEIRVAQGVYTPDLGTGDRSKFFNFHSFLSSATSLSLVGSFAGLQGPDPDAQDYVSTRTILSADLNGDDGPGLTNRSDNSYIIAIIGAQRFLKIDGVTVRGANTEGSDGSVFGGGMLANAFDRFGYGEAPLENSVLTVSNCTFEENVVYRPAAAGLSAVSNYVDIRNCRFISNTAIDGWAGGLLLGTDGNYRNQIVDCEFVKNSATFGGGVVSRTAADFERCVFVGNQAEYQGGATFGSVHATASLFVRNTAGNSGGAMAGGAVDIASCTLAENSAPEGAAISLYNGSGRIRNSIFWQNAARENGAIIRFVDSVSKSELDHSIIQGGVGAITSSGVPILVGSQIINADPMFIRAASSSDPDSQWPAWNYRLRFNSPAIGIGGEAGEDLDGHQRWYDMPQLADAGCYFVSRRACDGNLDRDQDNIVDDADFSLFVGAYNLLISPPANPDADLNRDGLVNDADFSLFAVAYDQLFCP